jgi:hypothetical protein
MTLQVTGTGAWLLAFDFMSYYDHSRLNPQLMSRISSFRTLQKAFSCASWKDLDQMS